MQKMKDPLQSKFEFGPSTAMLIVTLLCPIVAEWIRRGDPAGNSEAIVLMFNVFPRYFAPATLLLSAIYFFRYHRAQYAFEFLFLVGCIIWLLKAASTS